MINSNFSYQLSQEDKIAVNNFFDSQNHISIDQHVEWAEITVFKKICYFSLFDDNKLIDIVLFMKK